MSGHTRGHRCVRVSGHTWGQVCACVRTHPLDEPVLSLHFYEGSEDLNSVPQSCSEMCHLAGPVLFSNELCDLASQMLRNSSRGCMAPSLGRSDPHRQGLCFLLLLYSMLSSLVFYVALPLTCLYVCTLS